jgi:hypothetical protein
MAESKQDTDNVEMANGDDAGASSAVGVVSTTFEGISVAAVGDDGTIKNKYLFPCKLVAEYDPEVCTYFPEEPSRIYIVFYRRILGHELVDHCVYFRACR